MNPYYQQNAALSSPYDSRPQSDDDYQDPEISLYFPAGDRGMYGAAYAEEDVRESYYPEAPVNEAIGYQTPYFGSQPRGDRSPAYQSFDGYDSSTRSYVPQSSNFFAHKRERGAVDPNVERWRTIQVEYRNSQGHLQTFTALKDSGSTVGLIITMSAVRALGLAHKIRYYETKGLIRTITGEHPIAVGTIDLTAAQHTETFQVVDMNATYDIVLDATWCFNNDALARGRHLTDSGYVPARPLGGNEINILGWSKKESKEERQRNAENMRIKNQKAIEAEARRKERSSMSGGSRTGAQSNSSYYPMQQGQNVFQQYSGGHWN